MRKFVIVPLMALLLVLGLGGCGGGSPAEEDTFRPVARGEGNHCYYVETPRECDKRWDDDDHGSNFTFVPFLMPLLWQQMYSPYYSSAAYVNNHVPAANRAAFRAKTTAFNTKYKTEIAKAQSTAKYKSTSGKIVTGNQVNRTQFGTGSRTAGTSGSRTKTCSLSPTDTTILSKGGTGGGGSRGGSSGGSRSGTTGGSKSGTKSGTTTTNRTGGC